jgi:hypothetical protein
MSRAYSDGFQCVWLAASTDKCWVFDLCSTEPGSGDFDGALLKCLLNGVARPGEETNETLYTKLKYTMLWSRDDLMNYLLERMNLEIKDEERRQIFDKAIIFALKSNKGDKSQNLYRTTMYDVIVRVDG